MTYASAHVIGFCLCYRLLLMLPASALVLKAWSHAYTCHLALPLFVAISVLYVRADLTLVRVTNTVIEYRPLLRIFVVLPLLYRRDEGPYTYLCWGSHCYGRKRPHGYRASKYIEDFD